MQTPHRRFLRYSRFPRLRRSGNFIAWLVGQASRLATTADSVTFTAAAEVMTATAHPFATGEGPFVVSTTGVLPAGLDSGDLYWLRVLDANTFQFHRTHEEAVRNENAVATTDAGTGTHSLEVAETDEGVFEILRRNRPETVEAAADIDDLR